MAALVGRTWILTYLLAGMCVRAVVKSSKCACRLFLEKLTACGDSKYLQHSQHWQPLSRSVGLFVCKSSAVTALIVHRSSRLRYRFQLNSSAYEWKLCERCCCAMEFSDSKSKCIANVRPAGYSRLVGKMSAHGRRMIDYLYKWTWLGLFLGLVPNNSYIVEGAWLLGATVKYLDTLEVRCKRTHLSFTFLWRNAAELVQGVMRVDPAFKVHILQT